MSSIAVNVRARKSGQMQEWSKQASSAVVALVLIPLIVQLLGWYIKGEGCNATHGLLVGVTFSAVAFILFVIGNYWSRLYLLLIIALVVAGVTVTVVGFVAVVRSSVGATGDNLGMFGILAATCGLLVCCISGYLAYADLKGGFTLII